MQNTDVAKSEMGKNLTTQQHHHEQESLKIANQEEEEDEEEESASSTGAKVFSAVKNRSSNAAAGLKEEDDVHDDPGACSSTKKGGLNTSFPRIIVKKPTVEDVLCGRGKICFEHPGNKTFRLLIAGHANTYQMAPPTKKMKMQVVMLIVDIVTARGGRFLTKYMENHYKDNTMLWAEGGRKQGRKKAGHAFCDALRGRVKCMTQIMSSQQQSNIAQNITASSTSSTNLLQKSQDDHDSESSSSSSSLEVSFDELEVVSFEAARRLDVLNPTPLGTNFRHIKPSTEWRNSKIDRATANDLLDFVIADQKLEDEHKGGSAALFMPDTTRSGGGSRAAYVASCI
jgi:hypothetical protein